MTKIHAQVVYQFLESVLFNVYRRLDDTQQGGSDVNFRALSAFYTNGISK